MEEKAKFIMIDEGFVCEMCGKEVSPLKYTARDHCPYCLVSKHVDNNPGDRECDCHGMLKPISIESSKKGRYKIIYNCQRCNIIKKNIAAKDDDINKIIEIMSSQI